ncbi:MAG: tetraacyldisaccharide 4'-kinase [Thermodesulfobacteriota bacterium]|nr:tetraacyldisaccharide 4'-kinase [Thermodesulfobacteriota bacterium]
MIIFYNILLFIVLVIGMPFFLVAAPFLRKRRGTVLQRLGFGKLPDHRTLAGKRPIWIHALSVGEIMSARPLVKKLTGRFPDRPIWISATTKTGFETAARLFDGTADHIFYAGYDARFAVKRIAARVNPALVIVVESDIWPNFLHIMGQKQVPVVLVNGRLSDRTLAGYRRLSFFMRPTLRRFSAICAQTAEDARRFQSMGIGADSVTVTGNMKFDQTFPPVTDAEKATLRSALRLNKDAMVMVAGSTHKGEETILARAYATLKQQFPTLVFIVAPRDPARAKQVRSIFSDAGVTAATMGRMKPTLGKTPDVIVIDTIGLLQTLYAISRVAFIGGSLLDFRGHNPLEPAAYAKPVLFGPHMTDFKEIAEKLVDAGGAKQVTNASDIVATAGHLLQDPISAQRMGDCARRVLDANRGAVKKTADVIEQISTHQQPPPHEGPLPSGTLPRLLWPLCLLYGAGARLRRWLYHGRLLQPKQLPCPVIAVGNITTGGTGKTPMTVYIADRLKRIGYTPVIVSRGYRGSASRNGGVVSDGKTVLMDADQAGDEPLMMARILSGVPVVVGKKKYQAAKTAIDKFAPNVIILDDGFQHFQLARNLNILLMDGTFPIGNGRLLPAGSLREPVSCLKYADAIVFTRAHALPGMPEPIAGMIADKPVFSTRHQAHVAALIPAGTARKIPPDPIDVTRLNGRNAFIFSGLAKNDAFLKGVKDAAPGINIADHQFFRDHHWYTETDLKTISAQAKTAQADLIITSEKDFTRLGPDTDLNMDLLVLGVDITFNDPAQKKAFDALLHKTIQEQ